MLQNKGVTMVELVALISIIGILALVVTTRFSFDPSKLMLAREKLITDIKYAQSLAVNQGGYFGVSFSPDNENYVLVNNSSGTPFPLIDPSNTASIFQITYINDPRFNGVDLVSADFSGTQFLQFDWQGVPYGGSAKLTSDGLIVLQNAYGSVTIRVNPETGRVSF